MECRKIVLPLILIIFLISLTGCCPSPNDIKAFALPRDVDVTAKNYVLQPPDEVEIHCTKVAEIHLQSQQIRPDGKVSFESLGEFYAAGKTPTELADAMKEKIMMLYSLTGEHPIDVQIVAYKSKQFYVLGQVYFPGPKEATGRDTVLTAISKARPNNLAWENNVKVIRPSADKSVSPKMFTLKYAKMIAHGDTSQNVLLQEGDIVYVPPTVVGSIGLVVEEFVTPIGRAFSTVNIIEGPVGN